MHHKIINMEIYFFINKQQTNEHERCVTPGDADDDATIANIGRQQTFSSSTTTQISQPGCLVKCFSLVTRGLVTSALPLTSSWWQATGWRLSWPTLRRRPRAVVPPILRDHPLDDHLGSASVVHGQDLVPRFKVLFEHLRLVTLEGKKICFFSTGSFVYIQVYTHSVLSMEFLKLKMHISVTAYIYIIYIGQKS